LIRQGFAAAMIHGDRSQSQRTAALAGFQRGSYRVLVATDVASRGIHVQDIAHVINYDMPADAEAFIHRAGRTGRAGERGVASTLFARDQQRELVQLERTLGLRMERMREGVDSWETMDGTATSATGSQRPASRTPIGIDRAAPASGNRMQKLPGEILQVQLES
jgi:superfamily II DNA/RNA helicase